MSMEQHVDQTQWLPGDVLAAVLGRLAPRSLAVARRVCKAWRDIIDARRMLRADLLPHSLAGFFINFNELRYSEFFSRPSPSGSEGPGIPGKRLVLPTVNGHCNGLVLLFNMVANPATGWSAPLPPPPPPKRPELERLWKFLSGDETPEVECLFDDAYLAFDPTVSSHYQVVLVPRIPYIELDDEDPIGMADPSLLELEWPPSSCVLTIFSSSTKQWEERTFFRVGDAAGTIADWGEDYMWSKSNAVYWHGALYVHCQKSLVMRYLSNSPCLISRYI
jgi:hypothetical protein